MLPDIIEYIKGKTQNGPCSSKELQDLFLPLIEDIKIIHEKGLVVDDLENNLIIHDEAFRLQNKEGISPASNTSLSSSELTLDQQLEAIVNFKSLELSQNQQDQLSDIFQLGLIYSSLALALPLSDRDNLHYFYTTFWKQKNDISRFHEAQLEFIWLITCLDRNERINDIEIVKEQLQFIVSQQSSNGNEFELLKSLQANLYDYSKKSKLLYKNTSNQNIDLTHIESADYILSHLKQSQSCNFNSATSMVDWEPIFKKIKTLQLESVQDSNNLGFSNLKIEFAQVEWYDVSNKEKEQVKSPLFFLPVSIIFKPNETDSFQLILNNNEMELNPALLFYFESKFNISLPPKFDISSFEPSTFLHDLRKSSESSGIKWQEDNTVYPGLKDDETWRINTKHFSLGSVNFKNNSLTKDYNQLILEQQSSPILQSLISSKQERLEKLEYNIEEHYTIAPSDPYQDQANAHAIAGTNFVIQGPPGTGKSQTISNIIADFVARDKKVLLVSSKKAALNTVHEKLKHCHLDHITTIIYNAKTDKKNFVDSLEKEYQERLNKVLNFEKISAQRKNLKHQISEKKKHLKEYQKTLNSLVPNCKNSKLHELYAMCSNEENINQKQQQSSGEYHLWETYGPAYKNLYALYQDKKIVLPINPQITTSISPTFWRKLKDENTFEKDISSILRNCENSLVDILKFKDILPASSSFKSINTFWHSLSLFLRFKEAHNIQLLSDNSTEIIELQTIAKEQHVIEKRIAQLETINQNWQDKIDLKKTREYLDIIEQHNNVKIPLLQHAYRNVIQDLYSRIKFPFLPSKNNVKNTLILLKEEHELKSKLSIITDQNFQLYSTKNASILLDEITNTKSLIIPKHLNYFILNLENNFKVESLNNFYKNWDKNQTNIDYIGHLKTDSFESYISTLKILAKDLETPSLIAPYIQNFLSTPEAKEVFLSTNVSPEELKLKLARNTLKNIHFYFPKLDKFTAEYVQKASEEISQLYTQLLLINQKYILAKQSNYLHKKLRLSSLSITGLSDSEKKQRKALISAIKILEKEFSKSRKIKTIRSLNESDAQQLIFDLKPVWLMSPNSVSDILPLQKDLFDLIVFDEASQVEIEEIVPTLYRTKQCIIVGDKMQMPPSIFFRKNIKTNQLVNSNESILHLAEKSWPSLQLKWHYRSKNDDLIYFNNSVFYENKLYTIPNKKNKKTQQSYAEIRSINEAAFSYEKIRETPLSFHYIKNGVFEDRKNKKEAQYIAELVKHFLLSKKELNLGIIALSSEQENEIIKALKNISYFDKTFSKLLKDKQQEQDYFQEIFIKNVENIQGEERDMIIVSIGYGFDKNQKLSKNFGPINHLGGERRLNVLFSRAKTNLLIVSSVKYNDIINSHNLGANCLKNYLEFSEKYSRGISVHKLALNKQKKRSKNTTKKALIKSIKSSLEAKGYYVKTELGNSKFQIPLAVKKKKSSNKYLLGILIDDKTFYKNSVQFSYAGKQQILNSFSWPTYLVISKNWLEEKDKIIADICTLIEENTADKKKIEKIKVKEDSAVHLSTNDLLFTRLETTEEPKKFWQIAGNLSDVVIQYGRLGKKGKTIIKNFENVAEVIHKKRKFIQQKEKKGYRRV